MDSRPAGRSPSRWPRRRNVGLNLYFIPRWSYLGAAITTVICETGLLAAYAFILRQAVGRSKIGEAIAIPGLATIPMAIAILATRHHHLFVSAVAGGIAYGVAMHRDRGVSGFLRRCVTNRRRCGWACVRGVT